jgi:superfamily II DNA or RNA helicase
VVSGILPLWPFQREAVDAVWEDLRSPLYSRTAVVLPTGSGKTVIFAHSIAEWLIEHPGTRVLVLVHTDELVQQAVNKMHAIAPHLQVGVVKAERNETSASVIIGSVQTLRLHARRAQITNVSLVIVDECHHATANSYRAILEHFGCLDTSRIEEKDLYDAGVREYSARVPAVGFTATLARGDGTSLASVWQHVSFTRDIPWMVRKRYLVVPRGRRVKVPDFDLSTVRMSRGDFQDGELGAALADSLAPELVAAAYKEYATNRSGIAFFPTVASAYTFADAFNQAGIKTEVVHGMLPKAERRAILERLEDGTTQLVANCMVLTEGFDSPRVSCIVVGRPTKSAPLYIQMVGRGLRVDPSRPYEDQDCLILDVVGVSERHGLRSLVDLSDRPVREHRDGESLLDLIDELDAGEGVEPDAPAYYRGEVQTSDFDPLAARSARTWGRTSGGTYFVPAGKGAYVFLYERSPGAFTVGWFATGAKDVPRHRYVCCDEVPRVQCACGKRETRRGALTEHVDMDLAMAMSWGEDVAVDMGADPAETFTKKQAPWRKKPASPASRSFARSLGIRVTDEEKINGGELSDRINKIRATQALDPLVAKLRKLEGIKS